MGIGRKRGPGGGGASLNFDVKAYPSEEKLLAAVPKENTIGIITTTPITNWIFNATEPETPDPGMVWISIGTSSPVEFNALKKNGIQVYPLSAKQYVGGAWVDKTAMSYRGGEWVDWIIYLYNHGDECENITGGWVFSKGSSSSVHSTGTGTKNNGSITLNVSGRATGVARPSNKIDLTGKSTLTVNVTNLVCPYVGYLTVSPIVEVVEDMVAYTNLTTGTVSLDLGDLILDGEYYVGVYLQTESGQSSTVTFDTMKLL